VVEAWERRVRRRASGVEEWGVGRGVELQAQRMAPAPADDVELAAARAD
jgi:hypothetical protein